MLELSSITTINQLTNIWHFWRLISPDTRNGDLKRADARRVIFFRAAQTFTLVPKYSQIRAFSFFFWKTLPSVWWTADGQNENDVNIYADTDPVVSASSALFISRPPTASLGETFGPLDVAHWETLRYRQQTNGFPPRPVSTNWRKKSFSLFWLVSVFTVSIHVNQCTSQFFCFIFIYSYIYIHKVGQSVDSLSGRSDLPLGQVSSFPFQMCYSCDCVKTWHKYSEKNNMKTLSEIDVGWLFLHIEHGSTFPQIRDK